MSSNSFIPLRVRIERVQKALGITAAQLSKEIRVTPEWLSKILRGHAKGSDDIGLRLDEFLRRQQLEPTSIYDEGSSIPVLLSEGGQKEYSAAPDQLAKKLRSDFEELLASAGSDRDRLGWLRVQLDQMLAFARSWLSDEDINRRALERAKQMTADADRHRRSIKGDAGTAREA